MARETTQKEKIISKERRISRLESGLLTRSEPRPERASECGPNVKGEEERWSKSQGDDGSDEWDGMGMG